MVSNVCYIIVYCGLLLDGIDSFHYFSPFGCSISSTSASNWKCFSFPQQPSLPQDQGPSVHGKFWPPFATQKRSHAGGDLYCVFGSGFLGVLLRY